MLLNELTESVTSNRHHGGPYWKLDLPNKEYVVYDAADKALSKHPFKEVWASSQARDAAQREVIALVKEFESGRLAKQAAEYEAKPLSANEQRYIELNSKIKKYMTALYPKDKAPSMLDAETAEIYADQVTKWQEQLSKIDSRIIRKSVLSGARIA